ncbi:MAG TPA: hypothetical protein VM889_00800 [Candidatus Thermoplasmatota archaeon]|nr:hypothetical protein [Candidatus Thermoplasmatota archaeon]
MRIARGAADVVVGDWVAPAPARGAVPPTIVAILPRRGVIARKASGATHAAQTLAANMDVALRASAGRRPSAASDARARG